MANRYPRPVSMGDPLHIPVYCAGVFFSGLRTARLQTDVWFECNIGNVRSLSDDSLSQTLAGGNRCNSVRNTAGGIGATLPFHVGWRGCAREYRT